MPRVQLWDSLQLAQGPALLPEVPWARPPAPAGWGSHELPLGEALEDLAAAAGQLGITDASKKLRRWLDTSLQPPKGDNITLDTALLLWGLVIYN